MVVGIRGRSVESSGILGDRDQLDVNLLRFDATAAIWCNISGAI